MSTSILVFMLKTYRVTIQYENCKNSCSSTVTGKWNIAVWSWPHEWKWRYARHQEKMKKQKYSVCWCLHVIWKMKGDQNWKLTLSVGSHSTVKKIRRLDYWALLLQNDLQNRPVASWCYTNRKLPDHKAEILWILQKVVKILLHSFKACTISSINWISVYQLLFHQ